MQIKSFVFLDTETTGLPHHEYYRTRITELCLISVQAEHISLGVVPRVQNKLNLCFNPLRKIQPAAAQITGLYNDDLDNESPFDTKSLSAIINFLDRLSKPICFVAHNGYNFDYPILRNHIELVEANFPNDLLCIDSLRAFREIINQPKINPEPSTSTASTSFEIESKIESNNELSDEWDDILLNECVKIEESLSITPPKNSNKQILNETTPPMKKVCNIPAAPKHQRIRENLKQNTKSKPVAQRRLNFDENQSKRLSFKLGDIYERLLKKSAANAHQAEADVQMMLELVAHLGDNFIDWANQNAILFNEIPKMEVGKKISYIN